MPPLFPQDSCSTLCHIFAFVLFLVEGCFFFCNCWLAISHVNLWNHVHSYQEALVVSVRNFKSIFFSFFSYKISIPLLPGLFHPLNTVYLILSFQNMSNSWHVSLALVKKKKRVVAYLPKAAMKHCLLCSSHSAIQVRSP